MAHRPRGGPVMLTRYDHKTEYLGYFLSEMENIREDPSNAAEEEPETNDHEEMDPNAAWLKKAGFENIVFILENTQGEDETVLESNELASQTAGLPKAHAAVIRQRMHTLRSTIRSKHGREKQKSISGPSDVKQLFDINDKQRKDPVELLSVEPRHSTPPLERLPLPTPSTATGITRNLTPPPEPTSSIQHITTSTLPRHKTPPPYLTSPPRKPIDLPISKSVSPTPSNGHTPTPHDMKLSCYLPTVSKSESLPSISLDPDSLGITMIDDLSIGDMEKIQCLAHIELTITFEENNIPLRTLRPVKPKNYTEEKQFGIPLATMMANDQKRHSKADIPLLFSEMLEYLEKTGLHDEGILRVSGSKQRIKEIEEDIDANFFSGTFSFEGRKPSDISSLLKQFLRELPVPLLTREHLPAFASIADINELKEQVRTLNLLILMLPPLHQRTLKRLLIFCDRVHKEKDHTKMNMINIATVLAPNLFCRLPAGKLGCDDIALAAKTSHVVLLLIRYHFVLWTVPGGMLRQVRFLYDSELKKVNERHVRQALQKMNQTESPTRKPENSSNIIRVKAPLFTCVCKAVNIQENPTAGTVVAKLRKRSQINRDVVRRMSTNSLGDISSHSDDSLDETGEDIDVGEQFLYEVGGNIGERRLDPNTNMLALYEVNPFAEWIVKPRNCPNL